LNRILPNQKVAARSLGNSTTSRDNSDFDGNF